MTDSVDIDAVDSDAFGLADEIDPRIGPTPHAHQRHQLLYASTGILRLETRAVSATLPPLRAAWIPAGVEHSVSAPRRASLRTVYLRAATVPDAPLDLRVFDVSPLAREMVLEAMRWPPDATLDDTGRKFFAALGALVREWTASPLQLTLPAAQSPQLAQVIEEILSDVSEDLDMPSVAERAGLSERTLLRRFEAEIGLGFREYVRTARILRAAELLGKRGVRIKEVAHAVGFASEAAFTRAFSDLMKERPSDYVRRITGR